MPSKSVFYGTVVVLVALLLLSSTAAGVFYGQYQRSSSQSSTYAQELDSALASYSSLANRYNASLAEDNATVNLLAMAVANLNTSTQAYRNASVELASLWNSYQELAGLGGRSALTYEVHMLVDYGNGTRIWHNDTQVEPGWNAYVITLVLLNGSIKAAWYPQYGEHFVTGVGGTTDNASKDWFLITYSETGGWQVAQVGIDDIPVANGMVFGWVYCAETASYGPACQLP